MADILRSTTLPVCPDLLEAPTPQTVVPWPEVLAFLHHLEALAEADTAFPLVETPGQVACVMADASAASPAKTGAPAPRPRRSTKARSTTQA
jgi:hypothetical protein